MHGFKIVFENGSAITLAASGIIREFEPVPFGQPLEAGDIVLDPDKVRAGDILEYHDHRNGRIRTFDSPVAEVQERQEA